ncbi:MAG: MotA/TolQ/ExbB proton channel family protein [Planctomycetales bacterium]|nr:MotA/TolQ/ExbB proton channel family protein [Planctomycetales bacterium]
MKTRWNVSDVMSAIARLGQVIALVAWFFIVGSAPLAVAQDDANDAADNGGAVAAQEEVVAPDVAATAPQAGAATPTSPPSYLEWTFKALGWFYSSVFLFLSFTLVALVVMNVLAARRENVCPLQLVEAFEANLNEKKYQEAYELAKTDESFLGQVLSAGLAKLSTSYPQAVEAMQEVGEEENMKIDHRLSYLSLIGTISPMIGLFGTVHGMINSFQVIAFSPTSPKPSELAAGISTALFTTLIGLFIAIPAIAVHSLLRNRFARLVLEVGILSDNLMSRFDSKKK